MTPAEVAYRVARLAQAQAERAGIFGNAEVPPPNLAVAGKAWIHPGAKVERPAYLAAAQRVSEGWLDVFAMRGVDLGTPPRWNRDPKTGIEAPLTYGKALDYRDPAIVGDI